MEALSRSIPSRLLGQAMSLAQLYLTEFNRVVAIDLWFNGAVIMLRVPQDPPTEIENDGENWRLVGTLTYE